MNTALAQIDHVVIPMVRKRAWTDAEKRAMVENAQATSFSAAARKYQIATSQLFSWQKQMRGGEPELKQDLESCVAAAYKNTLASIAKLDKLLTMTLTAAENEMSVGSLTAYNASCALTNIVNTTSKIIQLKVDALEKYAQNLPREIKSPEEMRIENEMQRMAESQLRAAVKAKIEKEARDKVRQLVTSAPTANSAVT